MTKFFLAAAFIALPAFASPILDPVPSARIAAPYQLVHEGHDHVHGTGTVNSVDEAGHKINLSHGPIPQVGWPAMTMDFAVAPSVDLTGIAPGARVDFTLDKGPDGIFMVESLKPAKDGK